jgi:adenosine/AMP kinase
MKRCLFIIIICLTAVTAFAQLEDMTFYREYYLRDDGSFNDRHLVLEDVRAGKYTGIGSFYLEALKYLLYRGSDITTKQDRAIAEQSAVILCEGIGEEKYAAAADDLWKTVTFFDIARDNNEGFAMQAAIAALGQIGARQFLPYVIQRLNGYNVQTLSDLETRRRVQRVVTGCVNTLELFHDIEGYKSVFFVSVGGYEKPIQDLASAALPNMVDDPSEVIIPIINDPSNNPRVKLAAWREMLRTKAPGASKAKVAGVALAMGWNYSTTSINFQTNLREMRKSAIEALRQFGAPDDSVFPNLDKSYTFNFNNNVPDYDEIRFVLNTLSSMKTPPALDLLYKILHELHDRRLGGPWTRKERQILEWVLISIGATKTKTPDFTKILMLMRRETKYTSSEKKWVETAMKDLGLL